MSLAELAASSEPDRGADLPPHPSTAATVHSNPPLRLKIRSSTVGRGAVDVGRWTDGRDPASEAMDLVDHFPEWFDRICRIEYAIPDPAAAGLGDAHV